MFAAVEVGEELGSRLGADVPGGDGHRLDPPGPAGDRRVDGVLEEDDRVVVREGDATAAEPLGRGCELLG